MNAARAFSMETGSGISLGVRVQIGERYKGSLLRFLGGLAVSD